MGGVTGFVYIVLGLILIVTQLCNGGGSNWVGKGGIRVCFRLEL